MSFRLKVVLSALVLSLLAFDGAALLMMRRSTDLNLSRERARALAEHHSLARQIESQIGPRDEPATQMQLSVAHNLVALSATGSGTVLYWYADGAPVVLSSPVPADVAMQLLAAEGRATTIAELADGPSLLCAGRLSAPHDRYTLITAISLAPLMRMNSQLGQAMVVTSICVSLALAAILLALLARLLLPISQLVRAARGIESGDYAMRAPAQGRDELGALARAFNRMAGALQRQMAELTSAAEAKERFADNLAHEMRTPVTAMRGYAMMLLNQPMEERDRITALSYIAHESARMQAMSESLLLLSSARTIPIQVQSTPVRALFERAVLAAESELGAQSVVVSLDVGMERICCEALLMESLLINLLVNAARASQPGAQIILRATPHPMPRLLVVDSGRGMTDEQLARATEPFYRTDKSRARKDGGAGLGLSIAKQIADCHGATLRINSKPGRGTTVCVEFTALLQPGEYLATPDQL